MIIIVLLITLFALLEMWRITIFFVLGDVFDIKRMKGVKNKSCNPFTPFVSIIIPAHNEEKVITRTLKSVNNLDYPNYEVIIMNDGSTDKTTELTKQFIKNKSNFTLVNQANQGKAEALNNGIKNWAKGELILVLDADSTMEKDNLSKIVTYFQNPKVVAISPTVHALNTDSFAGIIQTLEYIMGHRMKKALSLANMEYVLGGVGSIFRKEVLGKVSYYDNDTLTEDMDLTFKILNLGNRDNLILFVPEAICFTEVPTNLRDLYRQRFRWKYGMFQTFLKNKKIFFNADPKYTKSLTIFYLPYLLFSVGVFVIDPLLMVFVITLSFIQSDPFPILGSVVLLAFYTIIAIIGDETLSLNDKIKLAILTPFAYFTTNIIRLVEYVGLIKCLFSWKEIRQVGKTKINGWTHVQRVGNGK